MAEQLVTQKCAHPPCNCFATFGSKYCGDFCEDRGAAHLEEAGVSSGFEGCGCGHADCSSPSGPAAAD